MHRDSRLAFEEQSFNLVFKNSQTHDYQNIKCLEQLNQGLLIIFSHQNHTPSLVFKVGEIVKVNGIMVEGVKSIMKSN